MFFTDVLFQDSIGNLVPWECWVEKSAIILVPDAVVNLKNNEN